MYIYELSLETRLLAADQLPVLSEKMNWLAEMLLRHGHLAYGYASVPFREGKFRLLLNLVAPDALDIQHRKSYVKNQWEEIEALAGQPLVLNWLGNEVPEAHEDPLVKVCACPQPAYVLNGERAYSPVICLACGEFVPIYTLPETSNGSLDETAPGEGYDDIHFWKQTFLATGKLWFLGYAEATMIEMQMSPFSELSATGRKLARRIEFLTQKPTYYFLTDLVPVIDNAYITYSQAIQRLCPSCSQHWLIPEPLYDTYHFQCHPCRLMSELPRGYVLDGADASAPEA